MPEFLDLVRTIATIIGTLLAAAALFISVVSLRNNLFVQLFSSYTKRYQEVLQQLPESVFYTDYVLNNDPAKEAVLRAMRGYFDLTFEEWLLNDEKKIDRKIWEIWDGGISTAMSRTAFKQAWRIVKGYSQYGSKFESYMDAKSSNVFTMSATRGADLIKQDP